jgi:hypothetical protein
MMGVCCSPCGEESGELTSEGEATVRKTDDGGGELRRKQRRGHLVRPVQATEKKTWGIEYSLINKCVTRERTEGEKKDSSPAVESSGGNGGPEAATMMTMAARACGCDASAKGGQVIRTKLK